jgi:hypothetical protein
LAHENKYFLRGEEKRKGKKFDSPDHSRDSDGVYPRRSQRQKISCNLNGISKILVGDVVKNIHVEVVGAGAKRIAPVTSPRCPCGRDAGWGLPGRKNKEGKSDFLTPSLVNPQVKC